MLAHHHRTRGGILQLSPHIRREWCVDCVTVYFLHVFCLAVLIVVLSLAFRDLVCRFFRSRHWWRLLLCRKTCTFPGMTLLITYTITYSNANCDREFIHDASGTHNTHTHTQTRARALTLAVSDFTVRDCAR